MLSATKVLEAEKDIFDYLMRAGETSHRVIRILFFDKYSSFDIDDAVDLLVKTGKAEKVTRRARMLNDMQINEAMRVLQCRREEIVADENLDHYTAKGDFWENMRYLFARPRRSADYANI